MYEGTVQTEWDYSYMGSNPVSITYADGTTGISDKIQFTGWKEVHRQRIHGMGI